MVNISANGFAVAVRNGVFAQMKGSEISVEVHNLDLLRGKALQGCVIRATNNDGEYIVGCRMPQDIDAIRVYVDDHYSE